MKLTELEPSWRRHKVCRAGKGHGRTRPDGSIQWGGFKLDCLERVETLERAQGLWFDCPKCWAEWKAGKSRGPHAVMIWFAGRGVPDVGTDGKPFYPNPQGIPVRWNVVGGTGFHDLTITPSILLVGGCGWHGFITAGEASIL